MAAGLMAESTDEWGQPRGRQSLWRLWGALLGLLLVGTALASIYGWLWRVDLALYDAALPRGPAPDDIVIVAVDDASIAQLGRWPWRRALHAALLDRLREQGARAVALDILMTEPDAAEDQALATAMSRGLPTVLPLLVQIPKNGAPISERLPVPVLAQAAAAIGHADLELDRDGMVRSVFLLEGLGTPNRLHLAAALLAVAPGEPPLRLRGLRRPESRSGAAISTADPVPWVRDYQFHIPFLGPPGHFATLSYVDVLRNAVPTAAIQGKLVFVGATAAGLGDDWPTPLSGEGEAMSGIELSANVLQGLRADKLIRQTSMPVTVLLSLLPLLAAAIGLHRMAPRLSMLVVAVAWLLTLAASLLALRWTAIWWPPSAALASLLLLYPLWSWRRLAATQAFLGEELRYLAGEHFTLLGRAPEPQEALSADPMAQRIRLVRQATRWLRDARRFIADAIDALPDAVVIADTDGKIVLANPAAARMLGVAQESLLQGVLLDERLYARSGEESIRFERLAAAAPSTVELSLRGGSRHYLVRSVPFFDSDHQRVGTIIDLTDITALRAAQREREDVIRFLSHDMKSPASSLLGLAQLQRDPARALAPAALSQRLDTLAQRLITLVDGFVALARAETADPRAFDVLDLRDAIQDAYDEVWAAAEARRMTIQMDMPQDAVLVQGDRQLLARAAINLLGNAIKFSPDGSKVHIACWLETAQAVVRVADQGPGINADQGLALFQRFSRRGNRGSADPGGAGLGLAFVRVVAEKHGGRAWVDSETHSGAILYFSVASLANPALDSSLQ